MLVHQEGRMGGAVLLCEDGLDALARRPAAEIPTLAKIAKGGPPADLSVILPTEMEDVGD